MEEKIVCMACGKLFLYTVQERLFLEGLQKQGKIPEVISPKKCVPCRSEFRRTRRPVPRPVAFRPSTFSVLSRSPVISHEAAPLSETQSASALSPLPAQPPASLAAAPLSSIDASHPAGCMCPRCGDQNIGRQKGMPGMVITQLQPFPGTPTAEEIVVLVASDFEQLVCREDVVWRQGNRKITIRLADIGPAALKKAMEAAVMHWWKS